MLYRISENDGMMGGIKDMRSKSKSLSKINNYFTVIHLPNVMWPLMDLLLGQMCHGIKDEV